jgi:hypothetical protein
MRCGCVVVRSIVGAAMISVAGIVGGVLRSGGGGGGGGGSCCAPAAAVELRAVCNSTSVMELQTLAEIDSDDEASDAADGHIGMGLLKR